MAQLWTTLIIFCVCTGWAQAETVFTFSKPQHLYSGIEKALELQVFQGFQGEALELELQSPLPSLPTPDHEPNHEIEAKVENLNVMSSNRHFSAAIRFFQDGAEIDSIRVEGKYKYSHLVPALSQRLNRGDIVEASMMEVIRVDHGRFSRDTVTDVAEILGKQAKSTVYPGNPLNAHMFALPELVQKNMPVVMLYEYGQLRLRSEGLAMETGVRHQTIRVRNTKSQTIVYGVVEDHNVVRVAGHTVPRSKDTTESNE